MGGRASGSDAHRQGQRQAKEEPANDRKRHHGGEHGKEDEGEEIEAVHCAVDPEVLPRVVFAGADVVAVGKVAPADETALELTARAADLSRRIARVRKAGHARDRGVAKPPGVDVPVAGKVGGREGSVRQQIVNLCMIGGVAVDLHADEAALVGETSRARFRARAALARRVRGRLSPIALDGEAVQPEPQLVLGAESRAEDPDQRAECDQEEQAALAAIRAGALPRHGALLFETLTFASFCNDKRTWGETT